MLVEYGKAPVSMTNGIPTHLAGEWPGIKSCKFHSYKRVIRPITHSIFFNENEPPIFRKKKLLGPSPSAEYIHKSCIKIIRPTNNQNQQSNLKKSGVKHIPFIPLRIEKPQGVRHYFPYVLQKEKEIEKKTKSSKNIDYGRLEMKNSLSTVGFRNMKYNFNNFELLNKIKFNKDIFGNLKIVEDDEFDEKFKNKNNFRKNKNNFNFNRMNKVDINKKKIKINFGGNEKKNNSVDVDYVNNLNKWDKEELPQIIDNYYK